MRVDFNTLYALIARNNIPVSFEGLIKDYRVAFSTYEEITCGEERYDMLVNGFPHKLEELDKQFAFFIKPRLHPNIEVEPIIISRQKYFTEIEYTIIARIAGVPIKLIEEAIADQILIAPPVVTAQN